MNQYKPVYIYTTMTGNEEQDTAFFKRLDETGIRWRGGKRPSEYTGWRESKEYDTKLWYPGLGNWLSPEAAKTLSSYLPDDPDCEFQQVSAEEFIEAARKMA
jgi:hypothetical protein